MKQSLSVPAAAVPDTQLLATVRDHHIRWPHWQRRAGWIRTGLSGNVLTSLMIHCCGFFFFSVMIVRLVKMVEVQSVSPSQCFW